MKVEIGYASWPRGLGRIHDLQLRQRRDLLRQLRDRLRDPAETRRREAPGPVLDHRELELVLDRVGGVHVGQGAGRVLHDAGDARATPRADARREVDARVVAHAALELPADRREIRRVGERRARAVRAVDGRDLRVRQAELRVQLLDRRVVPARDRAQVDVRERRTVEVHAAVEARQVVGDRDRRERPRHHDAALAVGELLVGQRRVRRAEVDGPRGDRPRCRRPTRSAST